MDNAILVTGAAGFIGYHTIKSLLNKKYRVIGMDNMDPYYDVKLKEDRIADLVDENFTFYLLDITKANDVYDLFRKHSNISHIIHLAVKSGVRHSIEYPIKYAETNILGQITLLQACKQLHPDCHMIYASSSSVYGGNKKLPFSVDDSVNCPLSPYAATKRSAELISYTYSHLFGIRCTGLRFFTVYGPWGRPDMAVSLFTKSILEEKPFSVFNNGNMRRNFTYIDDIVQGILACVDLSGGDLYRLYNLGSEDSDNLTDFIKELESAIGKKALMDFKPLQSGDVLETKADIISANKELGFYPKISIQKGIPMFVSWFRDYYGY